MEVSNQEVTAGEGKQSQVERTYRLLSRVIAGGGALTQVEGNSVSSLWWRGVVLRVWEQSLVKGSDGWWGEAQSQL